MGITIIRTFSMANAIVETATVDCPLVNLTLTGANKDDTETLTAEGYTDGYRAEVELTWDATYWAVMTDGTAVQAASFLARTSEDSETTSTANPNGAWFALQSWTVTTVAGYTATSYYVPALEVAIASDSTGAVELNAATDDLSEPPSMLPPLTKPPVMPSPTPSSCPSPPLTPKRARLTPESVTDSTREPTSLTSPTSVPSPLSTPPPPARPSPTSSPSVPPPSLPAPSLLPPPSLSEDFGQNRRNQMRRSL